MRKKKGAILVLGLVIVVSGWWIVRRGSLARPEEGVVDVWATWGEAPGALQTLFDRYSQASDVPVKVTTGVDSDKVLKAMTGPAPPDVVVLSSSDLVESYFEQGLVEPLDRWIETTGIDLHDMYPAPLEECMTREGDYACLPWGCDVFALFWNKDLFEATGLDPERPPQTMEELVEYADKLTVRNERGELSQMGFIPDFPRPHMELYASMFGGSSTNEDAAELTDKWQLQFYEEHGITEVRSFVSSFNRYVDSSHPLYAGKRWSCQQCHRATPIKSAKIPERGFYDGRVAMMIDGQWQVAPSYASPFQVGLNYGVAAFPPPADHPERANTAAVEGPVVVIPAAAIDEEEAADLLAWMMSPAIVAEQTYASSSLPTSRTAAQDSRFQEIPGFKVFMELLASANARGAVTRPIILQLHAAPGRVEEELPHIEGGDPVPVSNRVQAQLSPELNELVVYDDGQR